jgi:hypothetical protein
MNFAVTSPGIILSDNTEYFCVLMLQQRRVQGIGKEIGRKEI